MMGSAARGHARSSGALLSAIAVICCVVAAVAGIDLSSARHMTAIVGEDVILDCPLEFPTNKPVPYVIEWKKQKLSSPLYIWYDGYRPHVADTYQGRVARVDVRSRRYGLASLNMTSVLESDAGWYECVVHFLNRSPAVLGNGTWVHLDVHAPPRLVAKSAKDVFVNIGDSVILTCEAVGTPEPIVSWYKADTPIQASKRIAIKNEGSELRISRVAQTDVGDYTCFAENQEGNVHWTSTIILAGGAVIVTGPQDVTAIETNRAILTCRGRSLPANFTVTWLREDVAVARHSSLTSRHRVGSNGSLVIEPVSADDAGRYTCQVSNGIGTPQRSSAYLNVEYAAHVPYTPSVQYLPMGLPGVIRCHIKANPDIQFVNWYRNRREFDPKNIPGVSLMLNGSLRIDKVTSEHQGTYMCRPFNLHGSKGDSADMQVVVRQPPRFTLVPGNIYQRRVYDTVQMSCLATGTPPPHITWRRHNNQTLPADRVKIDGGNITISSIRKSDFGYYECIARNSVSTIATSTQLVVEGTTPHAPHNITTNASSYAISVQWLPGYSGGDEYPQRYIVWYQQKDEGSWNTYEVAPPGTSRVTIYRLLPNTTYEIMVAAKNSIGDGMFSEKVLVRTAASGADPAASLKEAFNMDSATGFFPVSDTGRIHYPLVFTPRGPRPGIARDVQIKEVSGGHLLTWKPPLPASAPTSSSSTATNDETRPDVLYYSIKYKQLDGSWTRLGDEQLSGYKYMVKRLMNGKSYLFKVFSHSLTSFSASEAVQLDVPEVPQRKAITAALVGGLLLLIVSVILSVCTVKICNKHKRRKQEKEYNMVACRVNEARNSMHSPGAMKKSAQSSHSASGSWVPWWRLWLWWRRDQRSFEHRHHHRSTYRHHQPTLSTYSCSPKKTPYQQPHLTQHSHHRHQPHSKEHHAEQPHPRQYQPCLSSVRRPKNVYSVQMEYSEPLADISRTADGRFVLGQHPSARWRQTPSTPADQWDGAMAGDDADEDADDGGFLSVVRRTPSRRHTQTTVATMNESERRVSDGFGRHFIPTSPSAPGSARQVVLSPDGRRFRASSPGAIAGQLGPFELSAVSSVPAPDSAERTFPSTVLSASAALNSRLLSSQIDCSSNRQQSHQQPQQTRDLTPSLRRDEYDRRLPLLRLIHDALPAQCGQLYENWPPHGRWRAPLACVVAGTEGLARYLAPSALQQHSAIASARLQRHIEPPPIANIPRLGSLRRHSARQRAAYVNIGGEPAGMACGGTQRPLATSSPPPAAAMRVHLLTGSPPLYRAEPQAPVPAASLIAGAPAATSTTCGEQTRSAASSLDRRADGSGSGAGTLCYTRDRLHAAIGQVRCQHASCEPDTTAPHDSSSGLGSKNSSNCQQQQPQQPATVMCGGGGGVGGRWASSRANPTVAAAAAAVAPAAAAGGGDWSGPLDLSVDDHYEFDPVLTPADGESPLMPQQQHQMVTVRRPTAPAQRQHQQKADASTARVCAMRREFNAYRRTDTATAAATPVNPSDATVPGTAYVVLETVC